MRISDWSSDVCSSDLPARPCHENHVSFMTRTRRLAAGMVLGSVVVAATISLAQSPAFFRIGTGGTSGTYYPIGGLIANAISGTENSGVPGLVATAVSSNGSVANINAIQSGSMESGFSQRSEEHTSEL